MNSLYEEQRQVLREKHGNRWGAKEILAAIHCFQAEHGHPPTAGIWKRAGPWPSYNTVKRRFGSWASAIEAAGYPRPERGKYTVASRSQKRGPYRKKIRSTKGEK